ncbi:MAG: hypothetical protein Q8M29_16445, partial [Bacteroidota bacterium]|nr:hypothetical protein [Bacteroidota bacterium]
MKKQLLTLATLSVFGSASMFAQNNFVNSNATFTKQNGNGTQKIVRCGAPQPGIEWDTNFNKLVEEYVKQHTDPTGKVSTVPATIPVVVHIIHNQNSV